MPKCIVKGCTSGYPSNPEKHHFFKNLKNPLIKEQWESAVGRELNKCHYVCDRHFNPDDIINAKHLLNPNNGEIIGVSPYKIPRIKTNAVPSKNLFVDTELYCINKSNISGSNEEENLSMCVSKKMEFTTKKRKLIFQYLSIENKLLLPLLWNKCKTRNETGKERICFSKNIVKTINGNEKVVIIQELIIKNDMQFFINVVGKRIDTSLIGIHNDVITDIDQLEAIINLLDLFNVCSGLDVSDGDISDDNITSILYKDVGNVLRHNECELLLTDKNRCDKCYDVKQSVDLKRRRFQESGGVYKRRKFIKNTTEIKKIN